MTFLKLLVSLFLLVVKNDAEDCTKAGQFPIHGTLCKQYYSCISSGTSFTKYEYRCNAVSIFDPRRKECTLSSDYTCLETEICQKEGFTDLRYADINSEKTQKPLLDYIKCSKDANGVIYPMYQTCGTEEEFKINATVTDAVIKPGMCSTTTPEINITTPAPIIETTPTPVIVTAPTPPTSNSELVEDIRQLFVLIIKIIWQILA